VKKITYMLVLLTIGLLLSRIDPAFSSEPKEDAKLIGTWMMTVNSTDSSGKPCPFIPKSIQFLKDHTTVMSSSGEQHMPYKTVLTKAERQAIEMRNPNLAGKSLLVIKPSPAMDWASTPMVYGYSIVRNELTLTLQGWSPAKFARKAK
jgi:hypothetical protein